MKQSLGIEGRAGQVLEIGEGVGAGAACDLRGLQGKADGHAAGGIGIADGVAAVAVVATVQDVGVGIARQRVVVGRAGQVLDTDERIGSGADCVLRGALGRQGDGHAVGGILIARGVAARAAIQGVVAGTTLQRVVAAKAAEGVVAFITSQGVIEARSRQVLDAGEGVAAGTPGVLGRRLAPRG